MPAPSGDEWHIPDDIDEIVRHATTRSRTPSFNDRIDIIAMLRAGERLLYEAVSPRPPDGVLSYPRLMTMASRERAGQLARQMLAERSVHRAGPWGAEDKWPTSAGWYEDLARFVFRPSITSQHVQRARAALEEDLFFGSLGDLIEALAEDECRRAAAEPDLIVQTTLGRSLSWWQPIHEAQVSDYEAMVSMWIEVYDAVLEHYGVCLMHEMTAGHAAVLLNTMVEGVALRGIVDPDLMYVQVPRIDSRHQSDRPMTTLAWIILLMLPQHLCTRENPGVALSIGELYDLMPFEARQRDA